MSRPMRLGIIRGVGFAGGLLILGGTLRPVSALSYLGGAVVVTMFFVARMRIRNHK